MTRKVHNIPDYGKIVQEYYARALDIDTMPIDGPRHQRNTAFQARRHEQIRLLQHAWPKFFPNYSIPTHAELADDLGQIKTDSVADALYCFEEVASRQHKGRGVIRRDRSGKAMTIKEKDSDGTEVDTGKIKRTRRKIDSPIAYLRTVGHRMFGDVSDTPQLPPVTVMEVQPLALPSPKKAIDNKRLEELSNSFNF